MLLLQEISGGWLLPAAPQFEAYIMNPERIDFSLSGLLLKPDSAR